MYPSSLAPDDSDYFLLERNQAGGYSILTSKADYGPYTRVEFLGWDRSSPRYAALEATGGGYAWKVMSGNTILMGPFAEFRPEPGRQLENEIPVVAASFAKGRPRFAYSYPEGGYLYIAETEGLMGPFSAVKWIKYSADGSTVIAQVSGMGGQIDSVVRDEDLDRYATTDTWIYGSGYRIPIFPELTERYLMSGMAVKTWLSDDGALLAYHYALESVWRKSISECVSRDGRIIWSNRYPERISFAGFDPKDLLRPPAITAEILGADSFTLQSGGKTFGPFTRIWQFANGDIEARTIGASDSKGFWMISEGKARMVLPSGYKSSKDVVAGNRVPALFFYEKDFEIFLDYGGEKPIGPLSEPFSKDADIGDIVHFNDNYGSFFVDGRLSGCYWVSNGRVLLTLARGDGMLESFVYGETGGKK